MELNLIYNVCCWVDFMFRSFMSLFGLFKIVILSYLILVERVRIFYEDIVIVFSMLNL